jgi:hypothetical protein
MDAIRTAVESNNTESLAKLARALKTTISNFSSVPVTRAALRLETIANEGNFARAPEAYQELAGMIDRLAPELEQLVDS